MLGVARMDELKEDGGVTKNDRSLAATASGLTSSHAKLHGLRFVIIEAQVLAVLDGAEAQAPTT